MGLQFVTAGTVPGLSGGCVGLDCVIAGVPVHPRTVPSASDRVLLWTLAIADIGRILPANSEERGRPTFGMYHKLLPPELEAC